MTRRLKRSSNKIFGGVLGGFAEYFELDPIWIRLGFLVFAFTVDFGTAFLIYLIALFIMPNEDSYVSFGENTHLDRGKEIKEAFANRNFITFIGLGLILIGIGFLFEQIYHVEIWDTVRFYYYKIKTFLWPALLIILGIWIIIRGRKTR